MVHCQSANIVLKHICKRKNGSLRLFVRNVGRKVGTFETIIITDRHYSRVVRHKL